MNFQALRQSLKIKWLSYYEQNRLWLDKIRVWANYDGLRRPSSGFILATLSVLEPEFEELLGFILELNNNPDEIVTALGLNFNPETELGLAKSSTNLEKHSFDGEALESSEFVTTVALTDPVNTPHPVMSLVDIPVSSFPDNQEVAYTHQLVPALLPSRMPQRVMDYAQSELVAVARNGNGKHSQLMRSPSLLEVLPTTDLSLPPTVDGTPSLRTLLGKRAIRSVSEDTESAPRSGSTVVIELPPKGKPQPSMTLALVTEKQLNGKAVSVLEITNKVPGKPKTLLSHTLAAEIAQNVQYINTQMSVPPDKVNPLLSTNASSLASWVDEFCQGTGWNQEEAISI